MRGLKKRIALIGATAIAGIVMIPAADAGPGHDAVNFILPKFQIREGNAASIDVERGTHGTGPANVDVIAVAGGTADPNSDYSFTSDTLQFNDPIDADDTTVPTLPDSDVEPVETVKLDLDNFSRGLVPAFPNDAIVSIIDDDGPTRIGTDFGTYEIFENNIDPADPSVTVFVLRSGPASGESSVHYATQSDTAIAGQDFNGKSGDLEFQANQRVKSIKIPLINNGQNEPDETFDFVLSNPSAASLTTPSSIEITIHDDDGSGGADTIAPYTAFHQPLKGKSYTREEAKTLLAFMQDDEFGSGMDKVQIAIRKNKSNGNCTWWNGTDFSPQPCEAKRWASVGAGTNTKVEYFFGQDLAIFTLQRALKRSIEGSGIRNYTAFCRGFDKAGNVQTTFVKGQNRNWFEVK
jgi:Calx-beta domain